MKDYPIIHSGGAPGADTVFTETGKSLGFKIVNHSFASHRWNTNFGLLIHSDSELVKGDDLLHKAKMYINRPFPTSNLYVNSLIRRNYYQVVDSEGVVAVSRIDKRGVVEGGTAWAVYMAVSLKIPCYLYDINDLKWKIWDGIFTECNGPALFKKAFAGIGSREIDKNGEMAIIQYLKKYDQKLPVDWC